MVTTMFMSGGFTPPTAPTILRSSSATPAPPTGVYINQQVNCTNWVKIASSNYFNLGTSGSVTISNGGDTGYVIANAVRFMPLGSIAPPPTNPLPVVQIVASDAVAGEFGTNTGTVYRGLPEWHEQRAAHGELFRQRHRNARRGLCRIAGQRENPRRFAGDQYFDCSVRR